MDIQTNATGAGGRISRRASLGLGVGGLAWAGLGGRAEATPPGVTAYCPLYYGGHWNNIYYYYFCVCHGTTAMNNCFGFASFVPFSQMRFGCGSPFCISTHARMPGVPTKNPPTPTKTLPTTGSRAEPAERRSIVLASSSTATRLTTTYADLQLDADSKLNVRGINPLPLNTPFSVCTEPGYPGVTVSATSYCSFRNRLISLVTIKFPAFNSNNCACGDQFLNIGQETVGSVPANTPVAATPVIPGDAIAGPNPDGRYATVALPTIPGDAGLYHILGSTDF